MTRARCSHGACGGQLYLEPLTGSLSGEARTVCSLCGRGRFVRMVRP